MRCYLNTNLRERRRQPWKKKNKKRADNSLLANGARHNFKVVIGLGRLSKEQKGMLFSGEELPERIYKKGEGILLADGYPLREVKFPFIRNIDDWKKHIHAILQPHSGS